MAVAPLACAACLLLHVVAGHARGAGSSARADYASYCGIYSLHRAMISLGKNIPFKELVAAKYVGSDEGSSQAELCRAAEDFGLHCLPLNHVKTAVLSFVRDPVILHVKSAHGLGTFDHWILFMGFEGGRARICDGLAPVRLVGLDELAELWDGSGLVVSRGPVSKSVIYLPTLLLVGLYAGLGAGVVGLISLVRRGNRDAPRSASTALGNAVAAAKEGGLVLALSALIGFAYRHLSPEGYLSYRPAIEAIQGNYIFASFDTIGAEEVERHVTGQDVTFVDARMPADYREGHLRGAINIPPNSTVEQCASALRRVSRTARIVIYCQSNGCPYSRIIGQKILDLGYKHIRIYKDGWLGWTQRTSGTASE